MVRLSIPVACQRAVSEIAEEHGINGDKAAWEYDLEETRLMYAEPFRALEDLIAEALERTDTTLGLDFFGKYAEKVIQAHRDFPAFPEVPDTLRKFKEMGYKRIIMSNSCHSIMEYNLKSLENEIDDVLLAEDVKAYKPSFEFFRTADAKFGLTRENHTHIAQGYFHDIVPGKTLGWKTIWVNRDHENGNPKWAPGAEVHALDEIEL